MLNLFHIITIQLQGRKLYICDCMKYTFDASLRWDICESVSFKVGMMLDATKLYSMIQV